MADLAGEAGGVPEARVLVEADRFGDDFGDDSGVDRGEDLRLTRRLTPGEEALPEGLLVPR